MWCFYNGDYVQSEQLTISPLDHGFLYGLGLFETLRTYEGKPLLLEEHFARLQEALTIYRIAFPYTIDDIQNIIMQLNERNGGEDGYFRINVSAGEAGIGLANTAYLNPNVIIFRKPLELPPRGTEKNALWLKTVRNTPEQKNRFKSHHYANNIVARFEVASLKETEGFFLTEKGFVAEGITSNIFWAKDGIVYTPALDTGILAGITRAKICSFVNVVEGYFSKEDVEGADECFITTSIQELIPIRALGSKRFLGKDGAIYQKLHNRYVEFIQKELER